MGAFKRVGAAVVLWVSLTGLGYGQYAVQTVTLTKGWNSVYLQVEPADPSCVTVFGDWPVDHVSLYNMASAVAQFTESPDEPLKRADEFLTWRKPGVSTEANTLNAVVAGQAYLMFASLGGTRTLTGRPAVPRIDWVPGTNACNLVGFRQSGTAKFGTFLAGSGFDLTKLSVNTVSGTNDLPTVLPLLGGLNTTLMVPGRAYFIACDKVSSFSGPVKVFPSGTGGIFFPSNSVYQTLRLKNEHGAALTVTLGVTNSAAAASGVVPSLPSLQVFDYLEGWIPLTERSRTLQAGEEWTLPLALDRTGMAPGQAYGGLLVCSDTAGGRVEIPLEAEYGLADPTHALWPAGLWVGKASLSQVSQVQGDGAIVDGAKAGGSLELRLILHVDAAKPARCRLLQRVILAGAENTNGTWNASLYVDETKVPPGRKSARISSVAFGVKNTDIVWDDTYGGSQSGFGKNLRFTYTIAADDPVNPFRHPYHPDHDGLDARFKAKLPTGDAPQNYIGAIKPELFSISNTVSLVWTNAPAAGSGSAQWNPSEKATGAITFQVDGLRREGAILMNGAFELRRISQVGTLSLD